MELGFSTPLKKMIVGHGIDIEELASYKMQLKKRGLCAVFWTDKKYALLVLKVVDRLSIWLGVGRQRGFFKGYGTGIES